MEKDACKLCESHTHLNGFLDRLSLYKDELEVTIDKDEYYGVAYFTINFCPLCGRKLKLSKEWNFLSQLEF